MLQRLFRGAGGAAEGEPASTSRSAAQDDAFRTEPPFKLQGSYRNMNKLAEKVVAAMTDDELERLIDDHYQGESQTLTTGAEQNLLKLAELRGRLTPEQAKRWEEIKQGFARVKRMGGKEDDPVARVTGQLERHRGAARLGGGRGGEGGRGDAPAVGPGPGGRGDCRGWSRCARRCWSWRGRRRRRRWCRGRT